MIEYMQRVVDPRVRKLLEENWNFGPISHPEDVFEALKLIETIIGAFTLTSMIPPDSFGRIGHICDEKIKEFEESWYADNWYKQVIRPMEVRDFNKVMEERGTIGK